jgi:cell division protein FtsW
MSPPDRSDDVWASRRRHPTARPVAPPRRSKTFVGLLALITTLNLIGMVMVLSASSVSALDTYGSTWYVAMRQGMWMLIGLAMCIVVMRVDYHRWRRWGPPLLGVTIVLMALVLVPGVGMNVNGASR